MRFIGYGLESGSMDTSSFTCLICVFIHLISENYTVQNRRLNFLQGTLRSNLNTYLIPYTIRGRMKQEPHYRQSNYRSPTHNIKPLLPANASISCAKSSCSFVPVSPTARIIFSRWVVSRLPFLKTEQGLFEMFKVGARALLVKITLAVLPIPLQFVSTTRNHTL